MDTTTADVAHAADRLLAGLERAGSPVCVGIDPVVERLPGALRPAGDDPRAHAEAIASFSLGVLDAVEPHVGCVKIQAACFERYREAGVEALWRVIAAARHRGLVVVLDFKRGDIEITTAHYAAGVSGGGSPAPDWVTVNCYLGPDGMIPFLKAGAGAFALVRTSNPGGDALQARRLDDGRTVAEAAAVMVAETGSGWIGQSGYSALGAVVAATRPGEVARLRSLMPRQILLVPGFGAQGGAAGDVRACFDERGRGAVVSASRSVIYAFAPDARDWAAAVAGAAERFAGEVADAAGAAAG